MALTTEQAREIGSSIISDTEITFKFPQGGGFHRIQEVVYRLLLANPSLDKYRERFPVPPDMLPTKHKAAIQRLVDQLPECYPPVQKAAPTPSENGGDQPAGN